MGVGRTARAAYKGTSWPSPYRGPVSTGRLEAFSDGVFAIAITLLILDVPVPDQGRPLAHQLAQNWPHYATFVVSFLVIGIIWVNHHEMFRLIREADRRLLFLNLLLLMTVSFIPYPTAVLGEFLRSDGRPAALLYSGSMVAMAVAYNVVWRYASSHRRLLVDTMGEADIARYSRRNDIGLAVYAASLVVALISAPLTLVLYAAVALLFVSE
jgi:uncharacterized membrane protein